MGEGMDGALAAEVARWPEVEFDAIVRTDGALDEVAQRCRDEGVMVRHQYRLISALAVRGRGRTLSALAAAPHVTRIEADQDVVSY